MLVASLLLSELTELRSRLASARAQYDYAPWATQQFLSICRINRMMATLSGRRNIQPTQCITRITP